jgi:hypothetical protein
LNFVRVENVENLSAKRVIIFGRSHFAKCFELALGCSKIAYEVTVIEYAIRKSPFSTLVTEGYWGFGQVVAIAVALGQIFEITKNLDKSLHFRSWINKSFKRWLKERNRNDEEMQQSVKMDNDHTVSVAVQTERTEPNTHQEICDFIYGVALRMIVGKSNLNTGRDQIDSRNESAFFAQNSLEYKAVVDDFRSRFKSRSTKDKEGDRGELFAEICCRRETSQKAGDNEEL